MCGGNSTVGSNPTLSAQAGRQLDRASPSVACANPSMGREKLNVPMDGLNEATDGALRLSGLPLTGSGGLRNWSLKTPPGPEGSNGIG